MNKIDWSELSELEKIGSGATAVVFRAIWTHYIISFVIQSKLYNEN